MNRAGCLGFTLSTLAVIVPSAARADDEAPPVPTPAPVEAPPPPDDDGPPKMERRHPFMSLDGGYAVQNLYGIPITGMGFGAIFGGAQGDLFLGVGLEFLRGWTEAGLQTTNTELEGVIERRIDRWMLGGGIRVGTFDVSRVTETSPLLSLSSGAFLRVSYDLATFGAGDRTALYVLGKASADTVAAPLYGVGASLGVRL